jgi:two-component system, OmpR family, heavy metal sensor histidine kinase CusS
LRVDSFSPRGAGSARGSIARRLAWLYALSASALLIFVSGFLYWALVDTLQQEDEFFLHSRARILETILQIQPDDPQAIEREIREENVAFAGAQHITSSRILDESGRTLHESLGMKQEIPYAVFPAPQAPPAKAKRWHSDAGRTYWLLAIWIEGDAFGGSRRQIQVALDETGEVLQIGRYEYYLIGVLLVGILLSVIMGVLVTQRGMKPLADIASAAERVTATQLHERIDATAWPQELAMLTHAFDGMLDRLEGSFNRLFQFSADLAHELRTPLNNLRGEAEVALSRPREPHEYREILASSLEEYDRLSRILESLLFLAKADSEQPMLELSPINIRTEIEKIIVFYEALAAEQGISVRCEGDATAKADPDLFQRVISNLLTNALHYTPGGGTITFLIDSSHDDMGIGITCRDSGSGIPPEHLLKIFDRFYRINPSRSVKTEGAGLGLAIVKSIIDLHGGSVTVQSAVGQGTDVHLFFPA